MKQHKSKSNSLKKYHKWPAIIIAFILIYYSLSGILMNHREWISGFDIKRTWLPPNYSYNNWNQSSLKGNLYLSADSVFYYGNIGIWLTDSSATHFADFNKGFPEGIDNRKVSDLLYSPKGNLFAATFFGLYCYDVIHQSWYKINIDKNERFVAVINKDDTIIAMNRSNVFVGFDEGVQTTFRKLELKAPENYKNNVTLFETVWQIHSGEIFGLPGKLFVDILGLLIIILSVTGLIYFFFPKIIKRRKRQEKSVVALVNTNKVSLKWHNKIGTWFIVFLVILCLTGMFLRPPLLLTIARGNIPAIKFTHLDQPNPWYDDLRDIIYNKEDDSFILAAYNGMYKLKTLTTAPVLCYSQPPVSVMGINMLEEYDEYYYLIGSFSGLFLWNPDQQIVYDIITGQPHHEVSGRPFGSYAISGSLNNGGNEMYFIDYNNGVFSLSTIESFPAMPDEIIKNSPMSLWNFVLEVHTGRIFQFILGDFYILIVPITGIASVVVLLSGYFLYRKRKKSKVREIPTN